VSLKSGAGVFVSSQVRGKEKKRVGVAEPRPQILPDDDPDKRVVHRWRKKLCSKIDRAIAVDGANEQFLALRRRSVGQC
jgi:hypothetical protein